MALIENTLFGQHDRVAIAIERLQRFEPPEGYWVGISGGKDSTVIYDLCKKSGCKCEYHYSSTTIDPPEVTWHIRKHMKDVKIDLPETPLLQYMVDKAKIPPTRLIRWCCDIYKERGGRGNFVVTGIRKEESSNRKNRRMVESCFKDKNTKYMNIIIDWLEQDVWEYIKLNNLPYNTLYDEGFKRIGCVLCPMVRDIERQKKRFPKIYEAWHRAIIRSWNNRKEKGLKVMQNTAEEYFNWWLDRDAQPVNKEQMVLFE